MTVKYREFYFFSGLSRYFTDWLFRLWAYSLLAGSIFIWATIEPREDPIQIPKSESLKIAQLIRLQDEARGECLQLELESLDPVPDR